MNTGVVIDVSIIRSKNRPHNTPVFWLEVVSTEYPSIKHQRVSMELRVAILLGIIKVKNGIGRFTDYPDMIFPSRSGPQWFIDNPKYLLLLDELVMNTLNTHFFRRCLGDKLVVYKNRK